MDGQGVGGILTPLLSTCWTAQFKQHEGESSLYSVQGSYRLSPLRGNRNKEPCYDSESQYDPISNPRAAQLCPDPYTRLMAQPQTSPLIVKSKFKFGKSIHGPSVSKQLPASSACTGQTFGHQASYGSGIVRVS